MAITFLDEEEDIVAAAEPPKGASRITFLDEEEPEAPALGGFSIPAAPERPVFQEEPEASSDWDLLRGGEVALRQVPQLAYGVAGLVGATSEQITGYGEALRDFGFRGYKEWEESMEPISKDTDDITVAWDRAKQGDVGALVDWAQYGVGYALGQLGETAAVAVLGGLAGAAAGAPAGGVGAVPAAAGGAIAAAATKQGFKTLARDLVEKAIASQATKIVTREAERKGVKLTAEQVAKEASQEAIKRQAGKEIGSNIGIFGNAIGMQLGSIYGEAESKAQAEGRDLTGYDLARVWGTGLATGGVEGVVDKLGLDLLKGKLSGVLPEGRLAGAAVAGGVGVLGEAATEGVQTVGERFGAGKDILGDEALNEYINAAALGGLGGGVIGGAGGFVSGNPKENAAAKAKVAAEASKNIAPESSKLVADQADAVINEVAQETPDEKVARLQREAQEAAGEIELEEEGAGLPPVEPTPTAEAPVTPAEAPVEPVVPAGEAQPITATRTVEDAIRDKDTFIYNDQRGAVSVEDGVTVFRPFGTQDKFEIGINPNQTIGEIEGIQWARKGQVRTTPIESKPETATIVESQPDITIDDLDQSEPDFEGVPAALVEISKSKTLNDFADLFDTGDSKVVQEGKRTRKVSQTPEYYRAVTPQQINLANRLIDNALRIIDALPITDQQKQDMAEPYLLLDQDITNYENNPNYQQYKASIRTEVRPAGQAGVFPETETEVAAGIRELEQRAKAEAERLERARGGVPVTPTPVTPEVPPAPVVPPQPVTEFAAIEDLYRDFDAKGAGHARFRTRLDSMVNEEALTGEARDMILATLWDNNVNDEFLMNIEAGSMSARAIRTYGRGGFGRQKVAGPAGAMIGYKPSLKLFRNTRKVYPIINERSAQVLSTFWHEYGHVGYYSLLDQNQKKIVNAEFNKTTKAQRQKFFEEGVADAKDTAWFRKYYAKNESEWFAQSFAEYVLTQKSDNKKLVPVFEQILDRIKNVFNKLFNRTETVNLTDIFDFILRGEAYGTKPVWYGATMMSREPSIYTGGGPQIIRGAKTVAVPTPEVREARREPAITPQQDRDYLDAVERGDLDAAQRMVDDAADLAGYNIGPMWHGTDSGEFTTFTRDGFPLFFFSPDKEYAQKYGSRVIKAYLKINKLGRTTQELTALESTTGGRVELWSKFRGPNAIDGLISSPAVGNREVVVSSPEQIKSGDPVTYDDQGNIIPLSQRFQPEQADIRYARREPSEIKQQYAPKTDEEQKAFDKASSNKVLARNPQLAVAAVRMKNGEITAGEYADLVDALDPFVVKGAEPIPSDDKIKQYIQSDKVGKVGFLDENGNPRLNAGDEYEFRIDINTYNRSTAAGDTVYNITAHESVPETSKRVGEAYAYVGVAKVTNPTFITRAISGKGSAIEIAIGKGKFPLATVKGNYEPITELPNDINDPNIWTEVGYNPIRSSFFVDVRSKKALVGGTEAIMVGSRVFVKNAQLEARPTGITMGERYARRVQMGRAGMEQAAVEARLQELGFPTGGIIRVVNEPDADFEGRTIILDGKVTGIELNASALKDNAAIDRVLNHEFAESANADGALNRLVERLTPKEKKEINDTITRLRYEERARTAEEAARAIETLAEAWKGRGFFTRAVARVEAWASKLGFKLTRRAAEYIAARNLADINAGFRTAYNRFISTKEGAEARYSYAGPQAEMPQFMRDSFAAAQDMASKGEDAVTIRMATGWILNPYDKKLRWEIPDKNIKLAITKEFRKKFYEPDGWGTGDFDVVAAVRDLAKNKSKEIRDRVEKFYKDQPYRSEKKYIPLMFFINHSQLFKAYPDLAFVEVSFNPDDMADWRATQMAAFMPAKNRIIVSGSNLGMALSAGAYQDLSGGMRQRLLRSVMHEIQHWIQEKEGFAVGTRPQLAGFERYKRTAGEIEARDVEARMGLTESQRKSLEPYSSENIDPADAVMMGLGKGAVAASFEIRESRREPEAIPTFTEGTPEAATLKEMEVSMAKVDAASEAKGGKPETYKISEIASVWMDSGLGERELQDAIVEYTNLTPANAAKVAKAIARQYDKQQQIAEAVLETEAGVTLEGVPEGMEIPKDVDPKNKRTVLQRVIDAAMGVRVKPVILQVPEKTALKEQIRLKARETREAKKAQQETADAVVEAIKALELRGPMRAKQAQALAKRAAKVIWTSEKSMENFIAYAERVMANTNYDADLREAKAAQKRAKELSKRDSIAAPQRETLEAIGNIGINLLNDPREFADVVNHYLRSFKPVVSEAYVVVPDAEMKSYLSAAEDVVNDAKAEFEAEDNERLADKYGITIDELKKYMDAEEIMDALTRYAKREVIEGILNEKSAGVKEALKGVDTTILRVDQRKLIDSMKVIDVKSLDAAEKQAYVRIGNNIIFNNNQTNGAEFFVATAKGQQAARDLAKNTAAMTKNKAWSNIVPALGSRRAKKVLKAWAEDLQSVADTFRNAFGKEAMTVFYEAMGMVDLDLGFTNAARTLEEIQSKMEKFYKKLDKKYRGAATNQDGILSEGIVGYLIQNVPEKGEADSLAQRRGLLQQDIAERRKSGDEDRMQMADRIQQLMQKLDGETVDQILANLKREYPANYESLTWLKDELFPQYKDFLKQFDENFNDQANNYNTPNYLPIVYSNISPSIDLLQGKKKYYDSLSSAPKQSSYTIKRSDYTQLPLGDDGMKPKEIGLNLRKNAYNSLSDQITRAYTNPARQRIYSFLKTPESEEALGGAANRDFFAERIERLMESRERRGSFNKNTFEKAVDVLANLGRDIGTRIALAGSYQLIRQPADQVTVAIGVTGRADLMAKHLDPRQIKSARPVIDLFSIGRRGDASSGYKYINQMEGAQSRLERYYTEGNWVKAKEAAKNFADKFMAPLKVSDFTVAAATWMTFYRAYLAKNGIRFTTWEDAANLIKSDDVGHKRAAAYAENMTDIYQGSSDPTKMAVFAQKGKTGPENLLKAILVPFNSFGVQFRSRISSELTEIFTRSGDWKGKAIAVKDLGATIGGTIMFGLARRFVLPAITYGGVKILYSIFGVDVEEPDEEKQKEEFELKWRQLQGDIISTMIVGGGGQMLESYTIDGMNYLKYMIDSANGSEDVLDDNGEVMSFNQYAKERAPFYRYRSFDNAFSLGILDIGMDQAKKSILNTKMVLTPEEMERFTPEEQRFLYVALISDWLYLGGFNDADFARMWDKGRRDMIKARKEEEKEIRAIQSGR